MHVRYSVWNNVIIAWEVYRNMYMERWEGKVAVVTGASSGIGAAICMDLVRAGVIVVGLARKVYKIEVRFQIGSVSSDFNLDLSQKLKSQLVYESGKLHSRFCDLTNDESIEAAFNWIEERLGGVNILINSAGQLKWVSPRIQNGI